MIKNELMNKPAIKLVGLMTRTNNKNEMNAQTAKIGELAGQFWQQNIANKIPNRKHPGVTLSVYTEYDSNEHGDYTYFIGEEVSSFDTIPADLQPLTIKAANYQKFTTPVGKIPEVVMTAWQKIWTMSADDFGGERVILLTPA